MVKVSLDSGRTEPFGSLAPPDPAGIRGVVVLRVTPDGKHYAYGYNRVLSELLAVDGLR